MNIKKYIEPAEITITLNVMYSTGSITYKCT